MTGPVEPSGTSHGFDPEPIWTGMGPSAEMEAIGIHQLLSAAGIDAIVNGSPQIPSVAFEVLVAHDAVARAHQVVADALAAGPAGAEEAERDTELP